MSLKECVFMIAGCLILLNVPLIYREIWTLFIMYLPVTISAILVILEITDIYSITAKLESLDMYISNRSFNSIKNYGEIKIKSIQKTIKGGV